MMLPVNCLDKKSIAQLVDLALWSGAMVRHRQRGACELNNLFFFEINICKEAVALQLDIVTVTSNSTQIVFMFWQLFSFRFINFSAQLTIGHCRNADKLELQIAVSHTAFRFWPLRR